MQWAAVHGDHLQEEDVSVAFLEVSLDMILLLYNNNNPCSKNQCKVIVSISGISICGTTSATDDVESMHPLLVMS